MSSFLKAGQQHGELLVSSTELQTQPLQALPVMFIHTLLQEGSPQSILQAVLSAGSCECFTQDKEIVLVLPCLCLPFPSLHNWQDLGV